MDLPAPDWHLPSPSSTPRSAAYDTNFLQTPKPASFHSTFIDGFSTPQVGGHHTPAQTPVDFQPTSVSRPGSSYSQKGPTPGDPAFHVNYFSPHQHLGLPPVEPSRRLSSSPGPAQKRSSSAGSHGPLTASSKLITSAMDPSQMHTPPPTRHSSSRRQPGQTQNANLTTPSTILSRRIDAPPAHNATPGDGFNTQTPLGFSSLQFSPELYQFSNPGPMTAPVFHQPRLYFGQTSSGDMMNMDMSFSPGDPFGPMTQTGGGMQNWQGFSTMANVPNPSLQPSMMDSSFGQSSGAWMASSMSLANPPIPTQQSPQVSTPSGVDPSLLFSFANANELAQHVNQNTIQYNAYQDSRQAPEQQTREFNRGKGPARSGSLQHSRTSTASSSEPIQSVTRPGVQRSNTDSRISRYRPSTADPQNPTGYNIPRRSSPLKRQTQASLTAIPETAKPRARTRLVIDEDGRARTEVVHDDDEPTQSKAMRSFSSVQLDDDSDTESDGSTHVPSQNNSFAFEPPKRRTSKHARTDSDSPRSNSFKIPRSSSSLALRADSLGAARTDFADVPGQGVRRTQTNVPRRKSSITSLTGSFGGGDSRRPQAVSTASHADGDAHSALRRVVEGRQRVQERSPAKILEDHNQRWAQASADLMRVGTGQHFPFDPFSSNSSTSPTSLTEHDITTPSTDRSSVSNEGTRCLCNSTDGDGQLMIQCESCTKWLHVRCVGLNSQNLPPVYICIFCTGRTPAVRGGRVREPVRNLSQYMSPLNHKSGYRR
ncbi:hypothetical protein W97_01370 [Coniosporium apollinis CBS 100218]|uniref:PHD-type domain-containing protein n=1 Tax=Coniosporium apollinis (strain CBS 100218) TaxID=1168221 RepID=R7YKL5_CONA1|nr:uncharacterized protein W97_01370 [Coniosporium apollinis CBS 100218]EON62151.1 hypothetical protein W97_01370 [Coniosporium apollinis CBS 100218]